MPVQNDVDMAFKLLLDEIESVIDALIKEAEKKLQSRDFENASALTKNAEKVTDFREKVKNLQNEWQTLFASKDAKQNVKNNVKNLVRGLRTKESAFYLPILESLVELGGRAEAKAVLDKVRQKMENVLNKYDKQPLKSGELRWENTARWARKMMIKEGLLEPNSPNGIWEITDKGREYYLQHVEKLKSNNSVRQTSE